MGLAGTKIKQRFGLDPRNTSWSNNKSRFGHRYLENLGWTPGKGLGMVEHATTTHVKVTIKDDTVGLGAKLAKRSGTDELESDSSGLDDFQRILGRLNGRERAVDSALEQRRKEQIINGKWGMHFIKGEVLGSTWDRKSKKAKNHDSSEEVQSNDFTRARKRELIDRDSDEDESEGKRKKKKKEKKRKGDKKEKKENIEKKEKKDKKQKKEQEENDKKKTKDKTKRRKKEGTNEIRNKDEKRSKDSDLTTELIASLHFPTNGRLSARSKYIKQKRASVMDDKALNEIFMISK